MHRDPHTGNLLIAPDGSTVLADLDSSGTGPTAWDLAVVAVDSIGFGENGFRDAFVAASYGQDVTDSPRWPVLRRIAVEHAHRLATLRSGSEFRITDRSDTSTHDRCGRHKRYF
ncbi:phosphotransferase family protein [Nocardia sp. 2YAB30]|uniref:phosphotransferase family protein n=1 Tax=unclassified Nocardia TaxID=2637762 RepID=UPI003F99E652